MMRLLYQLTLPATEFSDLYQGSEALIQVCSVTLPVCI
ncbi:hypothetical protein JOD18_003078 [Gracilibacillus alcaliphilus]|nr:hypothetical protein [Gracilibacillus alcaliphilus]